MTRPGDERRAVASESRTWSHGCDACGADEPPLGEEIGTFKWWDSPPFAFRGPIDTILRLLEQQEITRAKARELLVFLDSVRHRTRRSRIARRPSPLVPWNKLNWSDD